MSFGQELNKNDKTRDMGHEEKSEKEKFDIVVKELTEREDELEIENVSSISNNLFEKLKLSNSQIEDEENTDISTYQMMI